MSTYIEYYMDQGTTFSNNVTIKNVSTSAAINISGYTFTSQLRKSFYSANSAANLVCTIINAANGIFLVSLDSANTANIPAGRYVFDIKMKDSANIVSRPIEGLIFVTPQVTK